MAFGSERPKRKVYFLSPRARDKGAATYRPHFKVQMKGTDGTISDHQDETEVSGYLVSIGHGEYEWPKDSGKKVKTINMYLKDKDVLYKIEAGVNSNMIRSLMNTVAGTKHFDVIAISLYTKNDFPQIYVTNNNQQCQWRFDYKKEIAPLITEAPDSQDETKTVKIYHKVNTLLWNAWLETEPIVKAYAESHGYTIDAPSSTSTEMDNGYVDESVQETVDSLKEEHVVHDDGTDDLPF